MTFSANSILNLDVDFKINYSDKVEMVGLEMKNNQEVAELIHINSGNKFYVQLNEINFLIGDD